MVEYVCIRYALRIKIFLFFLFFSFFSKETYLDAVFSAKGLPPSDKKSPGSHPLDAPFSSSSVVVGGKPDPVIKLDAFINLISEILETKGASLQKKIQQATKMEDADLKATPNICALADADEVKRWFLLACIVRDLTGTISNVFMRCGFNSAELLLPLVTNEAISVEALGPIQQPQSIRDLKDVCFNYLFYFNG